MKDNNSSINSDKELSDLYLNLYNGCVKFKTQKENEKNSTKGKQINCDKYYELFETHSMKYIKSKEDDN